MCFFASQIPMTARATQSQELATSSGSSMGVPGTYIIESLSTSFPGAHCRELDQKWRLDSIPATLIWNVDVLSCILTCCATMPTPLLELFFFFIRKFITSFHFFVVCCWRDFAFLLEASCYLVFPASCVRTLVFVYLVDQLLLSGF